MSISRPAPYPPRAPLCQCRYANVRARQRGMVAVVTVLFLIATVLFALSQMRNVSGNNVIDSQRQADSTAAFFLAESGLEKGHADVATTPTSAACIAPSSYALGRGNVSSLSGLSTPVSCGGSVTPCTSCLLTAIGTVGVATRTLTQNIDFTSLNGASCNASTSNCTNASAPPPTWKLNLVNSYATPAVALFSLAARRQGNNTGANCTNAACKLEWTINSQNGANSVGSMGNAVSIPSGASYEIYQTLSANFNLGEVGALFTGSGSGPSLTGRYSSGNPVPGGAAYWNEAISGSGGTVGKAADSSGSTNDGTWTDPSTDTCTTTPAPASQQNCTSWCYAGDTLVFGFAGSSASLADELSAVTFDTGGQNIALARVAKFPTSAIAGAPTNVYSEIWYVRNPAFLSASDARSGAFVTGSAGSTVSFNGSISINSTQLTVNSITGTPLAAGQVISGNIDAGTKICSQTSGTTGGVGVYTVSSTASCSPAVAQTHNYNNKTMSITATSAVLTVTAATVANLAIGDTIFGTGIAAGTTITALGTGTGGIGTYTMSSAQQFLSTAITSNGRTVTSSLGTVVPATTPSMIVSVKSGTGAFPAGTTITGTPTATSFTLSQRPTTPLANATLCGGTCAFFQHGAAATTSFGITKSAGTQYWGGGLMCLKGVDTAPVVVISSSTLNRRWTEVVR